MPDQVHLAQSRQQVARRVQLTMLRAEAEIEKGACHALRSLATVIEARADAQLRTRGAGQVIAQVRDGVQLSLDAMQKFWESHHALEELAGDTGIRGFGPDEHKVFLNNGVSLEVVSLEAA